ncbi:MAG: amino acid permease [Deltaproteobacteria bacterium]|nr:amino acid permease [Deltaproteobacteria bacterium]
MKKFETEVRLSREMGLMDATMIGVGAMIGAGIFVLIGIAAGVAGPALILTFVLNGLVALLTAMSYAELGSCFHDAGGGYLWVKEGLPKWNGFLSGWMSWFAHAVACSLYALGFGAYFGHVLQEIGLEVPHWGFISPEKLLAVGIAILFAYINFRGASETGKIGNLVTIAKIIILLVFIGFGLEMMFRQGDWLERFTPFTANGMGGVFKAMGLTFIAFQGFEVIAQSSEEIKNPEKNIPRAVFLSLAIVVPLYLLIAVTALATVKPSGMTPWDYLAMHRELALVEVARQFFSGGGFMILFGGLISTMSALNATIYSSSRVAFAMGRDRNFPAFFGRVHPKNFTPHWAILISLAIILFMVLSLPIEDVASAADIMFLLLFLQVNIAMIRLRKKRPDLNRGFSVPLFPVLSILGILMLLFLALYMFNYSIVAWIVTAVWIGCGLLTYRGYAAHREVLHALKIRTLERIERKDYRILVCLSSPRTMSTLTHMALAIARKYEAELIFLHLVEVREGQKLRAGLAEAELERQSISKMEMLAEKVNVPARSVIKVTHRISQGIIDMAAEENCNFIIIGRQKNPEFMDRVFSSLIDTVIQKAPAEVAVLHGTTEPERVRTILIPFGANIHTRLAMEIAPALAEYCQAKLKVALVFASGATRTERDEKASQVREMISQYALPATLVVVREHDVLQGIVNVSRGADLVLMGGRSGDFIDLLLGKSLTQEITEQVACPVLWVKEYEERKSFWTEMFRSPQKGETTDGE